MIGSLAALSPAARAVAQAYLDAATADLDPELRESVVDDLTAFLCERLDAEATVADVRAVTVQAGPVDDGAGRPGWFERLRTRLASGVDPSGVDARIAHTWWNPADSRLFLPRAIGLGWDLNFGALAVRLGLIEADAETEPFAATPEPAFRAAAALPAVLAGVTVLHYAVRGRRLPRTLPSHWDLAGSPDRWTSRSRAAATDLAGTVIPAAVAVLAAASKRPPANRAGTLAGATALATAGAAVTVWRSLGDRPRPLAGPALALAVAGAAGAVLFGLARAGRAAEIRQDLEKGSR